MSAGASSWLPSVFLKSDSLYRFGYHDKVTFYVYLHVEVCVDLHAFVPADDTANSRKSFQKVRIWFSEKAVVSF